jgi:hypothetical protein
VTAAASCVFSLSALVISSSPAPVAISMKESLVEVSPSMVMQLKEWSAASLTSWFSSACGSFASKARKPSMVAMLGLIMPAPLLMPVMVTLAADGDRARSGLGWVSVVMMARPR